MKIVHLCLACFFPDGYSYQENMLPKFHKLEGYEVEVIASLLTFDKNGEFVYLDNADTYINENLIKVTRLKYKNPQKVYKILRRFNSLYEALHKSEPDIIFIHGCQFLDMGVIVKYLKKNINVKVYVDNHADFSNSATNFLSKNILHGFLWRRMAKIIEPYTQKFYGVLPARVEFLINVYKLPKEKVELLVMGADDDLVKKSNNIEVRNKIRSKYNIKQDDFLVVTGGKIDSWKKQTLLLMDAVNEMEKSSIKLIVFGSVTQELKDAVKNRTSDKVEYIGWIKAEESYDYFSASDLVVFPGRHSVFWEQVAAQGKPMLCKFWNGTDHVNVKGNVQFLYEDSVEEIKVNIKNLVEDKEKYAFMKNQAECYAAKEFSYREIAKKSIRI